jgi:Protein of unknown function (DUF2442)
MSTLTNNFNSIENLISTAKIKIVAVDVHPELNKFIVLLNTGITIIQSIEKYKLLKGQSKEDLLTIEIIANGTGIHWPNLDEDLSLKGLLLAHLMANILPPNGGNDWGLAA